MRKLHDHDYDDDNEDYFHALGFTKSVRTRGHYVIHLCCARASQPAKPLPPPPLFMHYADWRPCEYIMRTNYLDQILCDFYLSNNFFFSIRFFLLSSIYFFLYQTIYVY